MSPKLDVTQEMSRIDLAKHQGLRFFFLNDQWRKKNNYCSNSKNLVGNQSLQGKRQVSFCN